MMQLLRSFHFSTYLTLALACLCLGYAEGTLLPESPYITAAVIVLIFIGYQLEGRWSLSLRAANLVGGGLTLILLGWILLQFVRKPTEIVLHLPFPAFVLPFLGPVLMILIPAKLFRPKHCGDYWTMQGIGLLAVSLGCALANDVFFGVLLIAYLFCFAWSMSLFHLYRETRSQEIPVGSAGRTRTYLFRTAGRWSLVILIIGLPLFLITPRPLDSKWELPMVMRGRMETGLPESNVDLNRTGTLEESKELAFTVEARDSQGRAKLDLPLDQHWRALSLVTYESGKWMRGREHDRLPLGVVSPHSVKGFHPRRSDQSIRLPYFGPGSYTLTYTLTHSTGGMTIAASPVLWREGEDAPIHVFGSRASPVVQRPDRFFEWVPSPVGRGPSHVQVTAAPNEPNLGPPMRLSDSYLEFLTRIPHGKVGSRVRDFTTGLLKRLIEAGKLTPVALQDLDPFTHLPSRRQHHAIARALEQHLSASGEFHYTNQLERADRELDPVVDFLVNTKAGHCQRFASALALMLRSQGIPAQLVLGFRGCESAGDGRYEVRQYHAHAWVETIIWRQPAESPPTQPDGAPSIELESQHWLSLDPTPGGSPESETNDGIRIWLEGALSKSQHFFKQFVLGYDSAARELAFDSIVSSFEEFSDDLLEGRITWPIAVVGGCVLLVPAVLLARRRVRRRVHSMTEPTATKEMERILRIRQRLFELLARHGLTPQPGQTAREFTNQVAANLFHWGAASVAEVPGRIAGVYYRVRFGGHTPSDVEWQQLDEWLSQLAEFLKTVPPQPSSIGVS